MNATVKAKRIQDGQYELRLGDQKIMANRLPDLYFEIELGGEKHKGYLKELKDIFARSLGIDPPAPAPVAQEETAPTGTTDEVRRVRGLDGVHRRLGYSEEGSAVVREDDEDPLPTIGTEAELVGETDAFEVRVQTPSRRFPYLDGYATIEKATRIQYGWCKDRSRALTDLSAR